MNAAHQYHGSCFCGDVRFTLTGQPVAMGFCHCQSCRQWSAAPVNAFTLWQPDALHISHGGADIGSFNKTEHSQRKWCTECGGHLYTVHPGLGLIDVYAAMIPQLPFAAGVHVHYQETVLRIRDGLPKFQDMPAAMGGSGVELAE